ncbi:MAG: hypothetical protein ACHQK9_10640 [Reyranellales bacterium]
MRLVFTSLLLLFVLPALATAQNSDNKTRPGHGAVHGRLGGSSAKDNSKKPGDQSTVQSGGQQATPPTTPPSK